MRLPDFRIHFGCLTRRPGDTKILGERQQPVQGGVMKQVSKFLGILTLEIEDMQDDIALLIGQIEVKRSNGLYTEYVARENNALYRVELDALSDFLSEVRSCDPVLFESVEEVIQHLSSTIPEKVRDGLYPPMMTGLLLRKMEKIRDFVKLSC